MFLLTRYNLRSHPTFSQTLGLHDAGLDLLTLSRASQRRTITSQAFNLVTLDEVGGGRTSSLSLCGPMWRKFQVTVRTSLPPDLVSLEEGARHAQLSLSVFRPACLQEHSVQLCSLPEVMALPGGHHRVRLPLPAPGRSHGTNLGVQC